MGLPANMTPKLIAQLNEECETIRDTCPQVYGCYDGRCIWAGWCDECWNRVRDRRVNGRIVGNLENGGLANGEKD